jgi:hypothetical protein
LGGVGCPKLLPGGKPDRDHDGFVAATAGGDDCDDQDPDIRPNADEVPFNDVDENCDGSTFPNPHSVGQWLGASLAVAFGGDRRFAALGGALLEVDASGAVLGARVVGPVIEALAGADDGSIVAAALGSRGVTLVETGSWSEAAHLPDRGMDVALSGQRLFVARGSDGIAWYDVTDPATPQLVSARADVGNVGALVVDGSRLYAANQDLGFASIDLSGGGLGDPARLALLGTARDLVVSPTSTRAYVATVDAGVTVIDITQPSAPVDLAETFAAGGAAIAVACLGERVFVGTGRGGVDEYALSDTSAPTAHIDRHGIGLAARGAALLVAAENQGAAAVDVTTPAAPGVPLTLAQGATVSDVVLRPPWGFALAGADGVAVLDLADRTAPSVVAVHALPQAGIALARSGDWLVVATTAGVMLVPMADPTTLSWAEIRSVPVALPPVAVTADESRIVVAADQALFTIDASTPASPGTANRLDLVGTRRDVALYGHHALVVGQDPALQVVDVADVAAPSPVGSWDWDGGIRLEAVAVRGDQAFVLEPYTGVTVLSLADPGTPTFAWAIPTTEITRDLTAIEGWLWLADARGLAVVELIGPSGAEPRRVSDHGFAEAVVATTEAALLARLQAGVEVVDLAVAASAP